MNRMIELVNQRTKIEKWSEQYLAVNSDLMDDVSNKHPVYKPYLDSMKEYSKIMDEIRKLEHVYNSQ